MKSTIDYDKFLKAVDDLEKSMLQRAQYVHNEAATLAIDLLTKPNPADSEQAKIKLAIEEELKCFADELIVTLHPAKLRPD